MQWIIDTFEYNFTHYYGLDYAAGVCMILSLWRLKHHHRDGFVYAALAAVFWILFNLLVPSPPGFLLNAIVGGMAVHSWANWKPAAPAPQPETSPKPNPDAPPTP